MSWQARVTLGQDSIETQHRWINALRQTGGHFACRSAKCTRSKGWQMLAYGSWRLWTGNTWKSRRPRQERQQLSPSRDAECKGDLSHYTVLTTHLYTPALCSHSRVRVTFTHTAISTHTLCSHALVHTLCAEAS